jgi:Uncharacterized conserved protein
MTADKWRIYDALIDSVPAGETVKNIWLGQYWLLLEAESGGFGLAQNTSGQVDYPTGEFLGRPLKEVAGHLKSWDFNRASVGLAAVNSIHNRLDAPTAAASFSREGDAFEVFMAGVKDRKVAVIGRFPYLERLSPQTRSLIVLERSPGPEDLPDTAAEFLLPEQDQVFITSTAFINKSMPRLLELCASARVGLVGPSTPLAPLLFDFGLSALSGLVVAEGDKVAGSIGASRSCISIFADGVKKVNLTRA